MGGGCRLDASFSEEPWFSQAEGRARGWFSLLRWFCEEPWFSQAEGLARGWFSLLRWFCEEPWFFQAEGLARGGSQRRCSAAARLLAGLV